MYTNEEQLKICLKRIVHIASIDDDLTDKLINIQDNDIQELEKNTIELLPCMHLLDRHTKLYYADLDTRFNFGDCVQCVFNHNNSTYEKAHTPRFKLDWTLAGTENYIQILIEEINYLTEECQRKQMLLSTLKLQIHNILLSIY
jgi:hypothetical protein